MREARAGEARTGEARTSEARSKSEQRENMQQGDFEQSDALERSEHHPPGRAEREEGTSEARRKHSSEASTDHLQDAAYAQRLEEVLQGFPTRDAEGHIPSPVVSPFPFFFWTRTGLLIDLGRQVLNDETIVVHPGSRYLKIGRGTDLT